MGTWDVIFCRNVTIYFKLESTRRVVSNFFDSLNEGGYLFVGHSETLTSISDQFEPVETGGVFLYRKPRRTRRVTSWSGFTSTEPVPAPSTRASRRAADAAAAAATVKRRTERRAVPRASAPAPEPA